MRLLGPYGLGGFCIAFLAACDAGTASTSDGSTAGGAGGGGASAGAGGSAGTAGVQGTAGTTGGSAVTGGTGGSGTAALSFATDIWPVFSQVRNPPFDYRGLGTYAGCTTPTSPCHSAASPGAGLNMRDVDTAYGALVNVASATSLCRSGGGTTRVIPGDPDRSCLILFYQQRLKDDLQWVDQAEIELVSRWIAEGARP
jgi:hypothetical protein